MIAAGNFGKKLKTVKEKLFLIKGRDIASLALLIPAYPAAMLLKKRLKKPVWLILERSDEAKDNGRAFFEYLMKYKGQEVIPVYAIQRNCPDFQSLKKYGRHVIEFGSFWHIVLYLACEANISSVKNMGPNDLMGYLFRRMNWMNEKMFFLQHGITVNHPDWLRYSDTGFRMIFCGAKPEYDYIRSSFGYPKGHVSYAGGLCRYDFLQNYMRLAADGDSFAEDPQNGSGKGAEKKQILILPSWRTWLKSGDPRMKSIEHTKDIRKTEYFKKWISFLRSPKLRRLAEKYGLVFVFYPHPTMQKYIREFRDFFEDESEGGDRRFSVKIADARKDSLNLLIAGSDLLVTDYSSVFFDFVYMKKPVIFYQFDREKFRRYHYPKGYFSYEDNPFGRAFRKEEDVMKEIESKAEHSFEVSKEFLKAHRMYFPVYDNKNCERTWEIIKSTKDAEKKKGIRCM